MNLNQSFFDKAGGPGDAAMTERQKGFVSGSVEEVRRNRTATG